MTPPSKARMVPADQPEVRATGGIVDPGTPQAGTEGTECLIPLASALMPLHDAPDIENVPAASSMHTLMGTVVEMHQTLREIGSHLGITTHAARPAAPTAPATPPVGVGTSGGAGGAQAGAHGLSLGDTLRHIGDSEASVLGGYVVERLAERADALVRDLRAESAAVGDAWGRYHEADKRADALEAQITSLRELAAELTFKGKGEPDDMPDEFELVRDEVAYMIRKRLGDAQ